MRTVRNLNTFNRRGIDGNGFKVRSRVHYGMIVCTLIFGQLPVSARSTLSDHLVLGNPSGAVSSSSWDSEPGLLSVGPGRYQPHFRLERFGHGRANQLSY